MNHSDHDSNHVGQSPEQSDRIVNNRTNTLYRSLDGTVFLNWLLEMPMPSSRKMITIPLLFMLLFCSCAIPYYVSKRNAIQQAAEFCADNEGNVLAVVIQQASNHADRYYFVSNGVGLGHELSESATSMVVSYTVPATCAAECEFQIKAMKAYNGKSKFTCN